MATPAVGDIDGDGVEEVVIAASYFFDADYYADPVPAAHPDKDPAHALVRWVFLWHPLLDWAHAAHVSRACCRELWCMCRIGWCIAQIPVTVQSDAAEGWRPE